MCNIQHFLYACVSTNTAEGRAPEVGAVGGNNNQSEVSPEYLLRAQFHVTGLSCASCVNKVERHLKKKSGMYVSVHNHHTLSLCSISTPVYTTDVIS